MQKSLFFMENLKCTAGEKYKTHLGTLAIDYGGLNQDQDYAVAPFDLIVKKIDPSANTVFFESVEPVETPSFIDFVCGRFAHCDELPSNCKVGAIIKQGEIFYKEGTKAQGKIGVVGSHIHAIFGRGNLTSRYWYDSGNGNYALDCTVGSVHQWYAFFIPQSVVMIKTENYTDNYPWVREGEQEKMFVKVHKEGLRIRKTLSFNSLNRANGVILKMLQVNGKIRVKSFISGIQRDGYQWIEVDFNGGSGYCQLDSQCYSIESK